MYTSRRMNTLVNKNYRRAVCWTTLCCVSLQDAVWRPGSAVRWRTGRGRLHTNKGAKGVAWVWLCGLEPGSPWARQRGYWVPLWEATCFPQDAGRQWAFYFASCSLCVDCRRGFVRQSCVIEMSTSVRLLLNLMSSRLTAPLLSACLQGHHL